MTGSTRRVLGGRYRLDSLLATGGMGQVWRACDVLLDRPVAVKVLRSEYSGDPTFLSRFRAEAHHSAGLVHRNIATLFDYGESAAPDETSEDLAYLVMELVEGEPLSALLGRRRRLDPERTLEILRQTASALAVAHAAGVVHRDVKPGNVLIGDDGVVRITDFGIAWSASSVPLTLTGQVVGTPHYLPPEQASGQKACPAGDVYALGLIGYECLAGRRAFDGDNAVAIALRQVREEPEPLPPDVPDDVRTLIGRALLKDPAERYPDGAAFRNAIEDVQAGRPLPPLTEGTATRAFGLAGLGFDAEDGPPPRRRVARIMVPVAALVAGAGIAVAGVHVVGAPVGPPAAAAGTTTTSGIVVVAADYVGRPVEEVEAELLALGLRVERLAQPTVLAPAGQVTGVSPYGTVRAGDLVTVTYATAASVDGDPAAAPVDQVTAPGTAGSAAVPPPAAGRGLPAEAGGPPAPGGPGDGGTSAGEGGTGAGADDGNGKPKGKPSGKGNGQGKGNGRGNG